MFHRVTVIGNLAADPEMRYTPDGVPVTNIRVASSVTISKQLPGGGERSCPQGWKESYNGKNWEHTIFWRIACWRGLAETVNQFLKKGRQVYVEGVFAGTVDNGTMEPRVFEANGKHRASYEITAQTVKFLGSAGPVEASEPDAPPADDWEDG